MSYHTIRLSESQETFWDLQLNLALIPLFFKAKGSKCIQGKLWGGVGTWKENLKHRCGLWIHLLWHLLFTNPLTLS